MEEAVLVDESRSPTRLLKEALDRCVAAALLVLAAPVLLLIAGLVSLTSSGPILHRRRVVGLNGIEFDAFKFRTMVVDADDILRQHPELLGRFSENMKLRSDPRLTPIGGFLRRTSLDELPQLLNVIRGEMSLVGPRMITQEEVPKYGDFIARRLSMKPGMTGLWQVSGRQNVAYDDRIEFDRQYVENWSLWLDMVILAKTIPAVLSMKGAY